MPLLNEADALYLGSSVVDAVYLGATQVWAAGSPFSPADLADMRAWFDASQISDIYADGASMDTWPDMSGNGLDLVQSTGSKRPTFQTGVLNGLPVVRFAGAQWVVRLNTTVAPTNGQWTAFVVAKRAGMSGPMIFFDNDGPNGHRVGQLIRATDLTLVSIALNTANTAYIDTGGALTADTFHVMSAVRAAASIEAWLDGSSDGSTATAGTPPVGGSNALAIGQSARVITTGGTNALLNGDVAECIAYDRALTTTERQDVESYLAAKWGL